MNIQTDSQAACFSTEEILINASVRKIFEIVADIQQWPEWQSDVSRTSVSGSIGVGTTFKWKAGGLSIRSRLHTFSPSSEIGWTGRIAWITAVHNWTFLEENGRTRVIVEETLKGLGSSFMLPGLKKGMIRNLRELKTRAESN